MKILVSFYLKCDTHIFSFTIHNSCIHPILEVNSIHLCLTKVVSVNLNV